MSGIGGPGGPRSVGCWSATGAWAEQRREGASPARKRLVSCQSSIVSSSGSRPQQIQLRLMEQLPRVGQELALQSASVQRTSTSFLSTVVHTAIFLELSRLSDPRRRTDREPVL